jgi:hypothetical protein
MSLQAEGIFVPVRVQAAVDEIVEREHLDGPLGGGNFQIKHGSSSAKIPAFDCTTRSMHYSIAVK